MNFPRPKIKLLPTLLLFFFFALLSLLSLINKPNTSAPLTKPLHSPRNRRVLEQIQLAAESSCQGTLYPDLCVSTVSTFPDLHRKSLPDIIARIVNTTVSEVRSSETNCTGIKKKFKHLDPIDIRALDDCLQLLQDTVAQLKKAISDLYSSPSSTKRYTELQTLFSGAMTNQDTCLDGFAFGDKKLRKYIEGRLRRISRHVSNSLAMLKKVKKKKKKEEEEFPENGMKDGFPRWLKKKDRALLQAPVSQIQFDLVVAKDGSGNFSTINDALQAAPNNSATRFVIYIKAGAYYEYIEVDRSKTMIAFIGDGKGSTLIKGNRSVVDGWTTFRSSTVAVVGNGFIARDIMFENYAGPIKHQAVALRSGSDLSAFYRCNFVAYQDTLYVHSFRQFYTQCDIYGTVDFIFGNAAVVFQNCSLYARRPLPNQSNIFTAQGRDDPNQNTGISILDCKVAAASDLIPVQSQFRTYLGRPWKIYSRTVYLLSSMSDVINPAGWLEWDGDLGLSTLYYREYKNTGPGSNTSQRVTWPGYQVITNTTEASQFTAANFVQGNLWLQETGFPFYLDLTPS